MSLRRHVGQCSAYRKPSFPTSPEFVLEFHMSCTLGDHFATSAVNRFPAQSVILPLRRVPAETRDKQNHQSSRRVGASESSWRHAIKGSCLAAECGVPRVGQSG